jgi:hypothetical protein
LIDRDTACRKICGNEYSVVAAQLAKERAIRVKNGLDEPGHVAKSENKSVQEITDDDQNPKNEDET